MATLSERITLLERDLAAAAPVRPRPFVILRPEGDPSRDAALAEIADLEAAGVQHIVYEII